MAAEWAIFPNPVLFIKTQPFSSSLIDNIWN
jgi:hypothetical protein